MLFHIRFPLRRRLVARPPISLLLILTSLLAFAYFIAWRLLTSNHGRWHYNYLVYFHPIFAYILPPGTWSGNGPDGPPRFIPEIYNAPWMGTWSTPNLTSPLRKDGELKSPVILKLNYFSTVSPKAREKRMLIRKLSPLHTIPREYQHLVEMKFVLGHAYLDNWEVDEDMERLLKEEQDLYGDMLRLDLYHGENLREGKILDWIHAVGKGKDGGREAWYLFKVDDDTVLDLPVFLDSLLALDHTKPTYLGTSLARWPDYHAHFTELTTGFSWSLLKTIAYGIGNMSRGEIERGWDDDVLTGEIMYCLPPAPQCQGTGQLPEYCDPRRPPPWGWQSNPPSPDPRTDLIRHDYGTRMGEVNIWFMKGDIAFHGWTFKPLDGYEKGMKKKLKRMWKPPKWLEEFADTDMI